MTAALKVSIVKGGLSGDGLRFLAERGAVIGGDVVCAAALEFGLRAVRRYRRHAKTSRQLRINCECKFPHHLPDGLPDILMCDEALPGECDTRGLLKVSRRQPRSRGWEPRT